MRTFVYVDGFNLYYGALKRSSWKWLDLPALLSHAVWAPLKRPVGGIRIGLLTPGTGRSSQQLRAHADFSRHIRPNALANSQLPDPIPGTNIRKPGAW